MQIHIEDNLYIRSYSHGYEVIKKLTTKTGDNIGDEYIDSHGFYPTVEGCARKVMRMKIKEATSTNLKDLISEVQRIETEVKQLIQF